MPAMSSRFFRSAKFSSVLDDLRSDLAIWYTAIHEQSGGRIIVDSSKSPMYGALLGGIPALKIAYLHLERDSRAVAFSLNARAKRLPEYMERLQLMDTFNPAFIAKNWSKTYACSMLVRHAHPRNTLEMSYERLAHDPDAVIGAIRLFIEELDFPDLGIAENDAALSRYHSVGGNPIRFDRSIPIVRPDYEWSWSMRWRDRAVVTILTIPFLLRHHWLIRQGTSKLVDYPQVFTNNANPEN